LHIHGYASGVIAKEGTDKMKLRQVLAKRLRDLMERTPGLSTQVQVSEAAGVAQTTVSRILKSQVAATLDNVESLATVFGITPSELLAQSHASSAVITEDDRRTIQRLSVLISREQEAMKQAVSRSGVVKQSRKKIERHKVSHQAKRVRHG